MGKFGQKIEITLQLPGFLNRNHSLKLIMFILQVLLLVCVMSTPKRMFNMHVQIKCSATNHPFTWPVVAA